MSKKRNYKDRAHINKRSTYALGALLALFFFLTLRLGYIMIFKHEEYYSLANEQWTSEVKIDARRGKILDRNKEELAVSANVYRIDFDLNSIRSYLKESKSKYKTKEQLAQAISQATQIEQDRVLSKLNTKLPSGKDAGSATLIRRIEKNIADAVEDLGVSGVIVSPDTKRYYPNNNFLAHVLGSTDIDGNGLTGVEKEYNEQLSGVPGTKIAELDNGGEDYPYTISQYTDPVDGSDVTLSIDTNIQYFAEEAAQLAYTEQKAKAVSVLIMDPKTGEILAMVNKPDFDPNNPQEGKENFDGETDGDKLQKMWRNRLVNDTFEPGSIFKVVTAITAMENNVVNEDTQFTCNGSMTIGSRVIKCWDTSGHGLQKFPEIIQNSCNCGFMQLGSMIGKETLCDYIGKFGFGKITGIDLPGEASGIVKAVDNISETDLATISFGQTNTVNSVQYMTAFNAVANGGTWIQPHVMKEITHKDKDGNVIVDEQFEPKTRKVASEENCAKLRTYLEKVVTAGSATGTFIEGYNIAGKTGTAQKVINGVYGEGKYISSFVGMAPAEDPKVTIMITVDEPGADYYYASQVAVPYAKNLFLNIFNYMDSKFSSQNDNALLKNVYVPEVRGMSIDNAKKALEDLGLKYTVEGSGSTIKSVKPYPGYCVKEGANITISTEDAGDSNNVIMPSVEGYTFENAKKLLESLGITATSSGNGTVSSQSIPSGEMITKGSSVVLQLDEDKED